MWGDSWRVIIRPVVLILTEGGLYHSPPLIMSRFSYSHFSVLYVYSVIVLFGPNYNPDISDKYSLLQLSGTLSGVATTILSALLIFYRVYSLSRENAFSSSGGQYTRILYLLTESSALYAVGVLLYAISNAIPVTDANVLWLERLGWYADPIFNFSSVSAITMQQLIRLLIMSSVWLLHLWLRVLRWQQMMMLRILRQRRYLHLCLTHKARTHTSRDLPQKIRN